jgi:hypothetical protein
MFNRFFVWLIPDIANNIARSLSNSKRITILEAEIQERFPGVEHSEDYNLGHDEHSNDWKAWDKKLTAVSSIYKRELNKKSNTILLQREHIATLKKAMELYGDDWKLNNE